MIDYLEKHKKMPNIVEKYCLTCYISNEPTQRTCFECAL